jgi:hypothetical protein
VILTSCNPCNGDEPTVPGHAVLAGRVAKLVVGSWKLDLKAATEKVTESDLPEAVREGLEANAAAFDQNFDWNRVESYMADEYASRYSSDELREIFGFFSSATGAKFIADHADLRAGAMRRVALAILETPVLERTKANLAELIESLSGPEVKLVQAASEAPQIPPTLIAGRWYTDDLDEKGNGFQGWNDKKLSGFNVSRGVEINHGRKEFMSFEDEGVWLVKGRLLVETNFDYTEKSSVYLIESVTADELRYRYVDPGSESSKWPLMRDTRKAIQIPEMPAGYRDPYR